MAEEGKATEEGLIDEEGKVVEKTGGEGGSVNASENGKNVTTES